MGYYLNPGNKSFEKILNSKYVDKSLLLDFLNETINNPRRMTCFTRPRRFGKSFAAKMIASYYDRTCDSHKLFDNLKIAKTQHYETYINAFDVVYLDITQIIYFVKKTDLNNFVDYIENQILLELKAEYSELLGDNDNVLLYAMFKITEKTNREFFFVIDEWDALFREAKENTELQKKYIQFFRGLFKGGPTTDATIAGCYMTGILPIKKYGTESAMTDFREYSMASPWPLTEFIGFTENEVQSLCVEFNMDFEKIRQWYDGYTFNQNDNQTEHVYNPNSVMQAIQNKKIKNYWTQTESFNSLKMYIGMNFDGLKDAIIGILGGIKQYVLIDNFDNDLTSLSSKENVLVLLVHLGYLAYDEDVHKVYIPNLEVQTSFSLAMYDESWQEVGKAINESEQLLEATINGEAEKVADALDRIHSQATSILQYNNENSLSCALALAYYTAKKDYLVVREFPSGKGFADFAFIPRKNTTKPPLIIELKYDKNADSAITQIKQKRYGGELKNYLDTALLVGVNYDKESKTHTCVIEKF